MYANSAFAFNDHFNFTTVSFGSLTNPVQTFGVQSQIGNLTLTNIDSNNVYETITPKNSSNPNSFFYFTFSNVPPSVTVNSSTVPQTSYLSTQSAYNACKTNCVLEQATYIEIKAIPSIVSSMIICTALPCLTIEPAGSTDFLLILLAIVIFLILMIVGLIKRNPFPTLLGAMVLLIMNVGLYTNNTIIYGTNQITTPLWVNEMITLLVIFAFILVVYQVMKRRF